jgi:hypothetical protein
MDPDSDPAIFVNDLQDANKKLIKNKKFCLLLLDHDKDKSHKEVTKQ